MRDEYQYQIGLGGYWHTEALPDAIPHGQNSPQKPAYGLYAEQLSGSAFTRPRHENFRSWLYRILPSVAHTRFEPIELPGLALDPNAYANPTQLRWDPLPDPSTPTDFVQGLHRLLHNGNPNQHCGGGIYLYAANTSMSTYFYNADGELLWIPYFGECDLITELGALSLSPGEIAVIPRGIKFQVILKSPLVKGYLCENYDASFRLPDLGLIGSNGLANPKDFYAPTARYEDKKGNFTLLTKFQNRFFTAKIDHSPFDVVAWHGNYAPYKYSLRNFNAINTVSFDHCDPSIFTVLTSPSLDFILFPPRWMVAEHTFRPPYYHRNIMNEYMGLIEGTYDAKAKGFVPGGGSLHNCMSAHGPDAQTAERAMTEKLIPQKLDHTLAFMLESSLPWITTAFAESSPIKQPDYQDCWKDLRRMFNA